MDVPPETRDLVRDGIRRVGLLMILALAGAAWPLASAQGAGAATLRVNTTRDELVSRDGRCSLREAVAAVDSPGRHTSCGTAGHGSNTIVLRAGRYQLSIPPSGPDDNSTGDLNVTGGPLTITGARTGATVLDAHGLDDRVLSVARRARLTLSRLTITGGHPANAGPGAAGGTASGCAVNGMGGGGHDAGSGGAGGGIYNSGSLVLDRVTLIDNAAATGGPGRPGAAQSGTAGCAGGAGGRGGSGGGVYNQGSLTVIESTIQGNSAGAGGAGGTGGDSSTAAGGLGGAGGPGGSGGGIYNGGRLWVSASTIYDNRGGAGGDGGQGGAGPGGARGGNGGVGGPGGGISSTHGSLGLVNSTLAGNFAGAGGPGGGLTGAGGAGGNGGAVAVLSARSKLRYVTLAENGVGPGGLAGPGVGPGGPAGPGAGAPVGPAGPGAGRPGAEGRGGALFVQSSNSVDDLRLQSSLVASNRNPACAASAPSAITDSGHDLSYGDRTCPGQGGNPKLGPLQDNGGRTMTMALEPGSAAINRVPRRGARCPSTDQRGVQRPQGGKCDIGAFEFATPTIRLISPSPHASYERGSRVRARFRCTEGGIFSPVARCAGTVPWGRPIKTRHVGTWRFVVKATDKSGNRVTTTVRYLVWKYVNPLQSVNGLTPRRIDLGVDYAGWGPLLALGKGRVTTASNTDVGPPSCWAISCWPGGGIVVYRLLEGPFAGKYVYVAEHITVQVRVGQLVRAGQRIAVLHSGYPWSEFGWAAGPGPEAMAMADGHKCPCSDPGNWSTIEGRNFDHLLVQLGAPSGYLQAVPNQSMPPGWPTWSG